MEGRWWLALIAEDKGAASRAGSTEVPLPDPLDSCLLLGHSLVPLLSPAFMVNSQNPDHLGQAWGTQGRDTSPGLFCKEEVLGNFSLTRALSEPMTWPFVSRRRVRPSRLGRAGRQEWPRRGGQQKHVKAGRN